MTRSDLLREIASLVEAGVPLDKGLHQLAPRLPRPWRHIATAWSQQLASGATLAETLQQVPPGVPADEQSLIEAAESAGRLGPCLHEMARAAENAERRRRKLSTALTYPVLLFHGAAAIPAFLTFYQNGPWAAALHILLILLPAYALAGGVIWLVQARTRQNAPPALLALLDAIPLLGRGLRQSAAARFCSLLASLLESGQRVEIALEKTALAAPDARLRRRILAASSSIHSGATLTDILLQARFFDDRALTVIQSGELSGTLPDSLRRAADQCDFDAQQQLDRAALLAPVVCYLLAVLLAVAQILRMLAPLFSTYRQVLGD